jgi:hypothetical protein
MRHSSRRLIRVLGFGLFVFALAAPVYAQGGGATTSLSGLVVDTSGALIPGATVAVRNNATAGEFQSVTNESGTFTIPALHAGSYTVTVTLAGFKKAVLPDVRIHAATPASVRVVLEVGEVAEAVQVSAGAEILQTQSAAITNTMDVHQVSNLPLTSRSALDFTTNLPGFNTPGPSRDSTVNGLPQSTINITIDGMSAQDNYLKTTDGFFARVSPRLDAVEEVTVTTAAGDSASTGQGAVQVQFVTRSGTNQLRGTGFYYLRHHKLNANTWFNNRDLPPDPATGKAPKAENILHQPGLGVGGPIVLPGIWDGRDKGFFFVNYEESRSPGDITRDRNILHPLAERGVFRYSSGGQVRQVDLLALAATNGHLSTMDPAVGRLLADIRASTAITGQVADQTDPNIQRFTFQQPSEGLTRYTTTRLDFNLTERHRLSSTVYYNDLLSTPDTTNNREPRFPGFPGLGTQDSLRYIVQGTLRSTLGANLVNEFRVGGTGGRTLFSPELSSADFGGTSIADQAGFNLNISAAASGIQNSHPGANNSSREASTKVIENRLNWIKGNHSIQAGAQWTQADLWVKNRTHVPTVNFGIFSGDPADVMFNQTNFPGASNTNLDDARDLYAVLTGRVLSITGNARLNEDTDEYAYLGESIERARMREIGIFLADSWRWRPNLTINAGLRYELQMPFYPLNNSYSTATVEDVYGVSGVGNLFQPGVLTGRPPQFVQFNKGTRAYNVDRNNFAPNVGVAWTPGGQSGLLRRILGVEGDSVLRAGFALAYNRPGLSDFSTAIDDNPGIQINADRSNTLGNLGPTPGSVLLRNQNQLGPPAFAPTRVYPMTDVITEDVRIFDPNLQVPYAQTWSAGWQRRITSNMSVEVRYVGTRSLQGWNEVNYNELNIVENGFLDEFKLAQQNLQANIAAGRGANFRYFGPGTGTTPLPIFLAYFGGLPISQADNASSYGSTSFADSTFVDTLARFNPLPYVAANALDATDVRRNNALRAGLPANFLLVNPHLLGGAEMTQNGGFSRYNGLQLVLDKRLSHGLQVQGSYAFGRAYISDRYSFRTPYAKVLDAGDEGGVTHAFKANWVYELPFGRGRHFGGGAGPWLDRLIGGWSFDGIARIQSGRLIDMGNVRLVGMSKADLEDAFKLRFEDADRRIYMLPQDIIDNTVRAFNVSATSPSGYGPLGPPEGRYLAPANGPDCIELTGSGPAFNQGLTPQANEDQGTANQGFGECGAGSLVVTGPRQVRFDLSVTKRIPIAGRMTFEFRGEFLNAFNHPWFTPVNALNAANNTRIYTNVDNFRVRAVGENSSRIIQLVSRVTW